MNQSDKIIFTALLVEQARSTVESYLAQLLAGKIEEASPPVSVMWKFLGEQLQNKVKEVLYEIFHVDLYDKNDEDLIIALEAHMAEMSGTQLFHRIYTEDEVIEMSPKKFNFLLNSLVESMHNKIQEKSYYPGTQIQITRSNDIKS
ncbi:hypothetical protein [Vibrio natriegens]|uniref:Uncharacterized protein n=1 Tax=Vibrio natriegens NBRC 15636 = ATCC 14048 = DSM 759 TaxID=1219067 RepID=A0AAN0Y7F9_VIBNA|nr:hypothetical protein [Vibrio natriegens]ALR18550.1 hypothetical protein PN96_21875 [Vibrio natriegens NBRC 15636 = ATCC 14048 = DSM 759]ANQ14515.1 hypothetical protein BA890_17370 [Vibrio natriegens NBRC 15636 = ATCC 14048 = DSM 759]ANQ24404.1 hypothetical protein BA893_22660 [Vibrio natriegens]EPM38879.1 hypothetical protein M272_20930 [Vibrio natriegens NBRC 15636 = ATCC 14048 = DSM 759]MDX6028527.1 hypothetical protein [Vibrio natriegens NBRC 15636 = ATCC 14048 = DSM 759]